MNATEILAIVRGGEKAMKASDHRDVKGLDQWHLQIEQQYKSATSAVVDCAWDWAEYRGRPDLGRRLEKILYWLTGEPPTYK